MSTRPNIGRLWKRITVVLVLWRMLQEDSFFQVSAFSIHHKRHPVHAPVTSRRRTTSPSSSSLFMGGYYSEPQDTDDESSQDTANTHMIFGVRCRETAIPMDADYQHYITVLDPIRENDNDDDLFTQRQALVHNNEYQLALWFWNHHEHLMGGTTNDSEYAHDHHHWIVWESPYSRGLVLLTVAAILQAYEKTDEFVTVMSTSNSQQLPRIIQSAYLFYNGGDPNYMRIQEQDVNGAGLVPPSVSSMMQEGASATFLVSDTASLEEQLPDFWNSAPQALSLMYWGPSSDDNGVPECLGNES